MNLDFLWWLTLGVLIGFVAEWIWDWIWFRRRRQVVSVDVETQVSTLRGERDRLAADLRACGDRRAVLESDLKTAQGTLQTVQDELGGLRTRVAALSQENEQLRTVQDELGGLRTRVAALSEENEQLRAELATLRAGSGAQSGAQGQTLVAKQVGAADATGEVAELRAYNLALYDELAATRMALGRFAGNKGDPLIDIKGIGPLYQDRLYEAGIVTFEQVAAMHPDRLRAIVDPETTFELDTESWREQARQLARLPSRDPLIDINGIGPVYEQRLLNAGVTSFEQLASMSEAQIRAIIKPEAWQNVDIAAWIAEAKVLAQQVRDGTYRKGRY